MGGFQIPIYVILIEFGLRLGLAMVILLRQRFDPTTRLAWLLVVLILPVVGAVAYLLVGETRLGRDRIQRHREVVLRRSRAAVVQPPSPSAWHPRIPEPYNQIAALAESVGGNVPTAGNSLRLLADSAQTIEALIEDIRAAQNHVHLLSYIYLTDATGVRVARELMAAEERGVECRVLVDAVGSDDFLSSSLARDMRKAGVQVEAALPVNPIRAALFHRLDLRNHRKIGVIDGKVGYTGSQNIADASFAPKRRYAPWVDTMVRIEGPAVHDLQLIFCEDWFLDTDEWLEGTLPDREAYSAAPDQAVIAHCIATGPNAYNFAARQVFQAAIHLAREEVIITNPYFVPDESTVSSMITAARRGVETRMILPARNDSRLAGAASRSYYASLLEAGVKIFEFRAGLLHAKTMTVDRSFAIVTSANLDRRSLFLNFEVGLIVYDSDFASELRLLQMGYLNESDEVEPGAWVRRPWTHRLWQNAAGMLSPLL